MFDANAAQALGISGAADLHSESLEDQRHYLVHRLTMGWFSVIGAVLLGLVCAVLFLFGTILLMFPIAAATGALFVKGQRMISTSRRGLRALEGNDSKLPKARLLTR